MKFRQTDTPPVAAAKASFSRSTAYRFEKDAKSSLSCYNLSACAFTLGVKNRRADRR